MNYHGTWKNDKFYHDVENLLKQGFQWLSSHIQPPSMATMQRIGYAAGIDVWEHSEKLRSFRISENKYVTMKIC